MRLALAALILSACGSPPGPMPDAPPSPADVARCHLIGDAFCVAVNVCDCRAAGCACSGMQGVLCPCETDCYHHDACVIEWNGTRCGERWPVADSYARACAAKWRDLGDTCPAWLPGMTPETACSCDGILAIAYGAPTTPAP